MQRCNHLSLLLAVVGALASLGLPVAQAEDAPKLTSEPVADDKPPDSDPMAKQVGKKVELEGEFRGPGKFADYIYLNEKVWIYIKGPVKGKLPDYHKPIKVVGVLHYSKGYTPTEEMVTGIPPHYYFNEVEVTVLPEKVER